MKKSEFALKALLLSAPLLPTIIFLVARPLFAAGDPWKAQLKVTAEDKVTLKDWKAKSGFQVALVERKNDKVALAVLKGAELVASADLPTPDDCRKTTPDDDDIRECADYALDLAAYQVAGGDFAVGLRWNEHQEFPAGEDDQKMLALYQIKGSALSKVFDDTVGLRDEQRGPGQLTEEKCTLAVLKTKTSDHFDLKRHCVSDSGPIGDDDSVKPKKTVTDTTYHWSGSAYLSPEDKAKPAT